MNKMLDLHMTDLYSIPGTTYGPQNPPGVLRNHSYALSEMK